MSQNNIDCADCKGLKSAMQTLKILINKTEALISETRGTHRAMAAGMLVGYHDAVDIIDNILKKTI